MQVGVVGGGIFGVTVAVQLRRDGHEVTLFEREGDLLQAASGINQYRLHRGYHYPRSVDTMFACLASEQSFRTWYGAAIVGGTANYYAISHRDTKTDAAQFIARCEETGLAYSEQYPSVLNREAVQTCLRAEESLFSSDVLRDLAWRELRHTGVDVRLRFDASARDLEAFDAVVLATYASLNELTSDLTGRTRDYQFEVCEKPVVTLPDEYRRVSLVVMDGPFMCVDPLGDTGRFVLGNVVHAIHHTNVGMRPEIPSYVTPMLNRGIVPEPARTRLPDFIGAAAEFFVEIEQARHVGSMFTVRTVLPRMDHTDARPTLVDVITNRVFTIFSGKIGTCVEAAQEVSRRLGAHSPCASP